MMRAALLTTALALSACAQSGPLPSRTQPTQAFLYDYSVNVLASDGALCVANRPGKATVWGGPVKGCNHAWAVQVQGHENGIGPRLPLVATDAAAGQGPYVTVGDTNRSWAFTPAQ